MLNISPFWQCRNILQWIKSQPLYLDSYCISRLLPVHSKVNTAKNWLYGFFLFQNEKRHTYRVLPHTPSSAPVPAPRSCLSLLWAHLPAKSWNVTLNLNHHIFIFFCRFDRLDPRNLSARFNQQHTRLNLQADTLKKPRCTLVVMP